jgi:uncharacterized protein YbjT (DUF2867 family)
MTTTRKVATVFGGSGFIGRLVVKRLAARGYLVRAAVRDTEAALFLRPMGTVGQVVLLHAPITDPAAVAYAVRGADVVVNCVGVLAGDFQRVHVEGAANIARAAAAAGVGRLIHFSALGADAASDSLYARSKAEGERAVLAAFPGATILSPSVVFGPDDDFFNRFATMAQWLWVMPVIRGATRFQPVYVCDVADAAMAALDRPETEGHLYQLGGPHVWSMRELLVWILDQTQRHRPLVAVPGGLLSLMAAVLEHLPGKMLTRDQLRLLAHDNVVGAGAPGLAELGIMPTPVEMVVPTYLAHYRADGGRRHTLATT